MTELLHILLEISLPIILLIALGFGFKKIFKTDTKVLPKLNVYLIFPIVIFVKVYQAGITWDLILIVLPYIFILQVLMFLISLALGGFFHFDRNKRKALGNTFVLFNTGNFGIPLIELAFYGNAMAMASQLFIVIIQNITINTFGVFQASSGKSSKLKALKNVIKMPSLYAIALAVLFKMLDVGIPSTIMIPLNYITGAFIAMALITLGVQLSGVNVKHGLKQVLVGSAVKMLIAPVLGFALVLLLGIEGMLAQVLIIGISTPTAASCAIIAKEFDNEPGFSAQFVLATTVFCTLTLPIIIYFVRQYF